MAFIEDTANTNSRLIGSQGNDTILGLDGNDTLWGLVGDDWLFGGEGDDTISGEADRDLLRGNTGSDTLDGGTGNDILSGDSDDDRLNGGDGDDLLSGDQGRDTLTGGNGNDIFVLRPLQSPVLSPVLSPANDNLTNLQVDDDLGDGESTDLIRDFEDGRDRFALPGEYRFEDLAILTGGGDFITDTYIQIRATGEVLARLPGNLQPQLTAEDFTTIDTINFSAPSFQIREDGKILSQITLKRTTSSGQAVGVTLTPSNGTATSPDYNASPISVLFAAGETEKLVTLPIDDDNLVEGDETVNLTLSNPLGGARLGTQSTATLTIIDEDIEISLDETIIDVNEDLSDRATLSFLRRGRLDLPAIATVVMRDGDRFPATFPNDYRELSLPIRFAPGETRTTVALPIVNDSIVEDLELIELVLQNPGELVHFGGDNRGFVRLTDQDSELLLTQTQYDVTEGAGEVTVSVVRRGYLDRTSRAALTITPDTAQFDQDYTTRLASLTFRPGETEKTIALPIIDDAIVEPTERFNLRLSILDSETQLAEPQVAQVRITDNDGSREDTQPGAIAFAAPTYFANEDGNTFARITLLRRGGAKGSVSAQLSLSDGTASAASDYDASSLTVNFADGQTLAAVDIPIVDDRQLEPAETINLKLTNPTNGASLGEQQTASLTIARSDPLTLTFEGVNHLTGVGQTYADQGIQFSGNALGIFSACELKQRGTTQGFAGNFETAPSGVTALTYGRGASIVMNVANGFDSRLGFEYAAPFVSQTVRIFAGENGTGELLAEQTLALTPPGTFPTVYSPFTTATIEFTGTARSVTFGSVANKFILDDLTLG